MNSANLTLSHIITAIWLQIVTIVPMDGESIRRFAQVFLSSPEYNTNKCEDKIVQCGCYAPNGNV